MRSSLFVAHSNSLKLLRCSNRPFFTFPSPAAVSGGIPTMLVLSQNALQKLQLISVRFMVTSLVACFARGKCGNLYCSTHFIHLTGINCLDSLSKTIHAVRLLQEFNPLCFNIRVFLFYCCVPTERGNVGKQAFCQCLTMCGCFTVSALFWFVTPGYFHISNCGELMNFSCLCADYDSSCSTCPRWFMHRCCSLQVCRWEIIFIPQRERESKTNG